MLLQILEGGLVKIQKSHRYIFLIAVCALLMVFFASSITTVAQASPTTYYVDATGGNDGNNGTSPSSAWKTISKVSNYHFNPGDSILFKRGEVWRERLVITNSGAPNNPINYGAYGNGAKPMLLGSVERNAESDWVNEGGNIWSTVIPKDGNELLPNPSFDEDTGGWTFSVGGGADAAFYRDTETYDSSPASVRIDCVDNNQGNGQMHFYYSGLSVTKNEWYILSFRAKASLPFNLYSHTPNLQKSGAVGDYWFIRSKPIPFPIGTEWATYAVYFCVDATADDGQIFFDLANIPNSGSLYIDTLSFQKCNKTPLYADVGNLIFDNEESVGAKIPNEEELDTQGEFWFDSNTGQLKIYSSNNPANYYSDIECALGSSRYRDIWDDEPIIYVMADYITIDDLDLRYSGGDGIWGQEVSNVTIRDCDISYCGGTYQYGTARMGNGVTFWEDTHNCRVEGCKIHEIYDAGVSNQGEETNIQSNIYYQNNIIGNCEYSFELWDHPESSKMQNIIFENNICIGAGFGWGHTQRVYPYGPYGWHVIMWAATAESDGIYITGNVFYESSKSCFSFWDDYWSGGVHKDAWANLTNFEMDYNYYYQKSGFMISYSETGENGYFMSEFSEYQNEKGHDIHSITNDKTLVQNAAQSKVSSEDVSFLNELFQQADETALNYRAAPYAPQNPQATVGDGYIILNWSVPRTDGGSPITNYAIYRGTTPGGEVLLTTISGILTYTDDTVTSGQIYYYKVSAINSVGESTSSDEVFATPMPQDSSPRNALFIIIGVVIGIGVVVTGVIIHIRKRKRQ